MMERIRWLQGKHQDMMNNFCFHVWAQKRHHNGKNGNVFFGHHHHKPYLVTLKVTRAGFQLKN